MFVCVIELYNICHFVFVCKLFFPTLTFSEYTEDHYGHVVATNINVCSTLVFFFFLYSCYEQSYQS